MDISIRNIARYVICIILIISKSSTSDFLDIDDTVNIDTTIWEPEKYDGNTWIWQNYAFGSGVGNREELSIINIEVRQDFILPSEIINWQILTLDTNTYFAGIKNSSLSLYRFDVEAKRTSLHANIFTNETIKSFKILSFPNIIDGSLEDSVIVVLSIENKANIHYLQWFYLHDKHFLLFWTWKTVKSVKDWEYFKANDRHKLIMLYEKDVLFNELFSLVEIYDIKVDILLSTYQLCHQFLVSESFDVKVCPTRQETTMISLLGKNHIIVYEYKDENIVKCTFKQVQNISVSGLTNAICFESSNTNYLATTGLATNLFKLKKDFFLIDNEMQRIFYEIGDIISTNYIPIHTYRDEILLLVQLKNSTVIPLTWNGSNFKQISMIDVTLNTFDLTKLSIIPNYGFLIGNILIKLNVELIQLAEPNTNEMKNTLQNKLLLEDILNKQEKIVLKTNKLIEEGNKHDVEEDIANVSDIEIHELNTNKTDNLVIVFGSHKGSLHEIQENYERAVSIIYDIEKKLNEIENIVRNIPVSNFEPSENFNEVKFVGSLEIIGTLATNNLTIRKLNNSPMNILMNQCQKNSLKIFNLKSFPSIEFAKNGFNFASLNGIPLKSIQFEKSNKDYSDFELSNISKLKITKNLNASTINSIHLDNVIENLVLKNVKKIIPQTTIIVGQLHAAHIRLDYLNDIQYPYDYVLKSDPELADISEHKIFQSVRVRNLMDVKTINQVDADEYIILHADQMLKHQITFENLVIDKSLQIDGDIVGITEREIDPDMTLLNSNTVQSNTMFTNLYISGNIYVKNSINGTDWLKLDDLLLEGEDNIGVTGKKTFLGNVHVVGNLEIKTGIINNHFVQDFITLDTRQVLPNLSQISGNVDFVKVTYKELQTLEDKLNYNLREKMSSTCMSKSLIFLKPPIIDEFSCLYINEDLSGSEFANKIKSLLGKSVFEHLKVRKLIADNLTATVVNSINMNSFKAHKISKSGYQILFGNIVVENLVTKRLYSELINERSASDFENIINKMNLFYNKFMSGSKPINSLNVTQFVVTTTINEEDLNDSLDVNFIEQFIFRTDQTIKNIFVEGLVNGINFSRKANDLVLRSEEAVIFKGPKKMKKLKSNNLRMEFINGHLTDDVIHSNLNQLLVGPLKIVGSVNVDKVFESTGKFNNIIFNDISTTINQLDKTFYKLNGEFFVVNDTKINDLNVYGLVQYKSIDNLIEGLIFLDERTISIPGKKIFSEAINFGNEIFLRNSINDINLKSFFQNTLLIDDSFSMHSIIFNNDILIENDMVVQNNLRTSTINEMNIDELMENALYLNRPAYVHEVAVLSNVIFESDIVVEKWNDTEIESLLVLNKTEIIKGTLKCMDIEVNQFEVQGLINSYNLTEIYKNTLLRSTNQNITGILTFMNNVYITKNLYAQIINKVDINKATSLKNASQMSGNFVFHNLIEFKKGLGISRTLNGKNLQNWQSMIVPINATITTIFGNWLLMRNTEIRSALYGSGSINGRNIKKLEENIENETKELQISFSQQTNKLNNICQGLQVLKSNAEKMIFKFKTFDYLRVLDFDETITSVHHFELKTIDYIMVNFESCNLGIFAYTNEGFVLNANISNFGYVKRLISLYYKDKIYFVTIGKPKCNKNAGNLWSFENYQFKVNKYFVNICKETFIYKEDR